MRWRRDAADAQDLTQEFFTRALEKEYLSRYDSSTARFCTFVRACLDGFLSKSHEAARRKKRGGGATIESLDFARADADLAAHVRNDAGDPETWFHREWARALFADAVDRLRANCAAAGRAQAFEAFVRYDIDGPDAPERPSYVGLARRPPGSRTFAGAASRDDNVRRRSGPLPLSRSIIGAISRDKILRIRAGAASDHRFIGIWSVVVNGRVFVRSWSLKPGGWYRTFLDDSAGAIQVGGRQVKIRAVPVRSERIRDAVERAYAEKYRTPGSVRYVRGFRTRRRRGATMELLAR